MKLEASLLFLQLEVLTVHAHAAVTHLNYAGQLFCDLYHELFTIYYCYYAYVHPLGYVCMLTLFTIVNVVETNKCWNGCFL